MSVHSTGSIANVAMNIARQGREALVNAAGDAMKDTTGMTPFKKGELRTKRRIVPTGTGALAQWFAQHAAAQNAGRRTTKTGKVVIFKNYSTPGTSKGFVQVFIDRFNQALPRYFK
jgi:hypothetical protein